MVSHQPHLHSLIGILAILFQTTYHLEKDEDNQSLHCKDMFWLNRLPQNQVLLPWYALFCSWKESQR